MHGARVHHALRARGIALAQMKLQLFVDRMPVEDMDTLNGDLLEAIVNSAQTLMNSEGLADQDLRRKVCKFWNIL